ncbi:MAG: DUF3089 domain-containing protein [Spirochaetaceae bacterium]|jgi:pimeloyl-ACP methyl ester carboxylesterase|nr:DUF3089 domain-containing protein [Spirochaetaceae bacterium]
MKKTILSLCAVPLLFAFSALSLSGCKAQDKSENARLIKPEDLRYPAYKDNIIPVDYSDPDNWLAINANGQYTVDVFFLYPTSWRAAPGEYPIAKIENISMRSGAFYYLKTRASAFETAGNIYAPFYRQFDAADIVGQSPGSAIGFLGGVPLTDLTAAFNYYIKHYNKGKPFILAAHSQGSLVMAAFLALYMRDHPDIYKRMIAAYLIGIPTPKEFYEEFPHIKPAQSADDLGVVISYNTSAPVVDGKDPFSYPSNILINPITWVTDDSYAPKELSKGGIIVNEDGTFVNAPNLADAKINPATGTLIADVDREKFSSEAASRSYFPLGVLHENDIPLYYYDLRANAENRVKKWFEQIGNKTTD